MSDNTIDFRAVTKMSDNTIDFRTVTKEALFKRALKDKVINFGFIPRWRRKAFVQFCKDFGLIEKYPNGIDETTYVVTSVPFYYSVTISRTSSLPGHKLLVWLADLAWHRNWNFSPLFFYTAVATIHVHKIPGKPKEFDYIICTDDLVYMR